MKQKYKNVQSGNILKVLAKVALGVTLIMVWILIDKGNVYGQSAVSGKAIDSQQVLPSETSAPLLKDGDDGDGDLTGSEDDNTITIYPNPVIQEMVFDFEFTVKSDCPFEILDPQGKLVETGVVGQGITHHTVDLGKLTSGMYIVRLEMEGKPQIHRIIKH